MWWIESEAKVILDGIQGGKRVLFLDELNKGPFLGFPSKTGKEALGFRLGRLETSRRDGNVDFSKPSIQ